MAIAAAGGPQTRRPTPTSDGSRRSQPRGGTLGAFLNSGFGRAMEMGAGIGLGEDLINNIF